MTNGRSSVKLKSMNNLLLVVSIFAAVCNNVILHLLSAKNIRYNPFLFNAGGSLVWIIILLCIGGQGAYTPTTVLYGVLYGTVMVGFLFFKMQAITTGPILVASLLGCSSFVVTTVFNAIYWKEKIDAFGVSGILLMLVAFYLITIKTPGGQRTEENKKKIRRVWIVYCIFFLLFAASTGIIFKFHQTYDSANTNEMMIVSAVVSAAVFLLIYFISKFFSKKKEPEKSEAVQVAAGKNERAMLIGLMVAAGAASCIYNRLNVYLVGVLPSALFFPVFNGSIIMLASVAGRIAFKEKLTRRQMIGVCCGVLAIILISKFFGLFG